MTSTPKYPVTLELSASEEECRIGGVKGRIVKAKLLVKEGDQVSHRLVLTQEDILNLISALRSVQQRMEPVSTRVPLEKQALRRTFEGLKKPWYFAHI